MATRTLGRAAAAAFSLLAAAGCATLPDTDALIERHAGQAARFENASGPLSAQRYATVLAELKRKSGDIDILEKQIALEQAFGAALLGLGQGSADVAGAGYEALIATRFSRADETEADRIGLELTARAGYDPRAGVTLWKKMIGASQGGQPPAFLSSHPTEASRVQQIQALLPTVMPLYDAARRRG